MSAIFPSVAIDKDSLLCEYFLPYQVSWILAEDHFHSQKKQVFALAEKSVRIGWTYADAFKNVRKRLRFDNRDYLFATKDYPSALEYMRLAYEFTRLYNFTKAIVSHGEDYLKLPGPGRTPTAGSTEIKIGYIKFDNGSRIIAFSAHPQAMAVYGGDVGLDEFAKHPNAELLWQTAQGRVTWAYDMAVWSSHEGDDTLFNQFAQQARASLQPGRDDFHVVPSSECDTQCEKRQDPESNQSGSRITSHPEGLKSGHHDSLQHSSHSSHTPHRSHSNATREQRHDSEFNQSESAVTHHASFSAGSTVQRFNPSTSPWNLYFKVTITDAIELGLLDVINRTRDANLTPRQFLADCRARAGLEQIFQQSYMCNPVPAGASIVDWSAIERCRSDYQIDRVHLEAHDVLKLFGGFNPSIQEKRQSKIEDYLLEKFQNLLAFSSSSSNSSRSTRHSSAVTRLGFDIAASGAGDLCAIYIDEVRSSDLWLRALFTCRTEDWDFIKTVLFFFLEKLPRVRAAGDESGLGRQICWEAAQQYSYKFAKVNFAAKKQDLGFTLMNQLSNAEKHFPKDQPDIAADFFALRKNFTGSKWLFTEGRNNNNPASHCDIAWAGALATFAHSEYENFGASAAVAHESGWSNSDGFHPYKS